MLRRTVYLTCDDAARAGLWDVGRCCLSCHDDNDDYGYEMCSGPDIPRNAHGRCTRFEFDVCCAFSVCWPEGVTVRDAVARIAWTRHGRDRG